MTDKDTAALVAQIEKAEAEAEQHHGVHWDVRSRLRHELVTLWKARETSIGVGVNPGATGFIDAAIQLMADAHEDVAVMGVHTQKAQAADEKVAELRAQLPADPGPAPRSFLETHGDGEIREALKAAHLATVREWLDAVQDPAKRAQYAKELHTWAAADGQDYNVLTLLKDEQANAGENPHPQTAGHAETVVPEDVTPETHAKG